MSGALYSVSVITPGALAGGGVPAMAIRPLASGPGSRPRVKRIECIVHGSPATTVLDVYRLTTSLGTANVSVVGQGWQTLDVSGVNVDTGWSAAPTLPGTPIRIGGTTLAGVIGNGQIITFPEGVTLEFGHTLIVWSPVAGSQMRFTPHWEE
jgi:hypothetical protein